MLTFCEAEGDTWLNVAEYVREALAEDSMTFSIPVYARTFERILAMTATYRSEETALMKEISLRQRGEHDRWCEELASQGLGMQQIDAKEKEYAERQEQERLDRVAEFAADYIGGSSAQTPTTTYVTWCSRSSRPATP